MTDKPIRLQLSRRKGFDLQTLSRAFNGREAVNVSRPSMWGNPFCHHPKQTPGRVWGNGWYISVPSVEDAVECFREMLTVESDPGTRAHEMRAKLPSLRGKNLACWCKIGDPCHADVLIEIANRPICEEVA